MIRLSPSLQGVAAFRCGFVELSFELGGCFFGDGIEQHLLVREVTERGSGRDADLPGEGPHADRVHAVRVDESEGRLEEGLAKVSVVVWLVSPCHGRSITEDVIIAYFVSGPDVSSANF